MDPIGTLLLFVAGYGWGKPVPVVPHRLRGNRRLSWALVSFAGPFSNLVMAMIAAIPFRMRWLTWLPRDVAIPVSEILGYVIGINLGLMVLNLIPIPPLDGSRILAWLLPESWANVMDQLERFGGMGLMLVLLILSRLGIFALIIEPILDFLFSALLLY